MTDARVVIAGGGFAAVEIALALHALAGDRVRVTLVSPDPKFRYRPSATVEAFGNGDPRTYDLRRIADDLGAVYRRDRLEGLASQTKSVRLASGMRLGYDALVLGLGARARIGIPGALTFRDQRDVPLFHALLRRLENGALTRLVFAVPTGCTWPLPLYELALLSRAHATEHQVESEIAVVTPERTPLAIFGQEGSRLVADVLAEHGVRFIGGRAPSRVLRHGELALQFDPSITADRVVAVPQLHGNAVAGVPASWWGFVPVDACGRVEGLPDVYAAGDMTSFPIKQGGLAAQQADRIAETLVAQFGLGPPPADTPYVLRARLAGGPDPLFLGVELDAAGRPTGASLIPGADRPAGWTKVFARFLTPYLEERERQYDLAGESGSHRGNDD